MQIIFYSFLLVVAHTGLEVFFCDYKNLISSNSDSSKKKNPNDQQTIECFNK